MSGAGAWFDTIGRGLGELPDARPHHRRALPSWLLALVLLLSYGLMAGGSLYLSRQPEQIATIWFANAQGIALLAVSRLRRWPLLLLAVALANVAGNRLWGDPWSVAVAFVPANLVEIALGAALLRRAGLQRSSLRSPLAVLQLLLLGGLLPQCLGATLGALTLQALYHGSFASLWLAWFEGATLGAMSGLPCLLLLANQPSATLRAGLLDGRLGVLMLLAVALTLLCLAHVPFPFVYLGVPLLLAALLVEPVAVALLALVVAATMAVAMALGLFVPPPITAEWQQVFVYLACAASLVPALLLSAALAELRDQHARLLTRTEELRLANEGLEQFVHIASHDLREPLNTIAQFSGLVAHDHGAQLSEEAGHYLHLVRRAAERMRQLLDDVLRYARLQRSPLPPASDVALDVVLAEVLQSLAGRIRESGADVRVDGLPVVQGQASLLVLLFQNLVANALKFVPAGQVPRIEVSAELQGDRVRVSVSDNGIGIAEADQVRLFRPFQRLHPQRLYPGNGLGLALARHIAALHGGDIELASRPGSGSRFTVNLPLAD